MQFILIQEIEKMLIHFIQLNPDSMRGRRRLFTKGMKNHTLRICFNLFFINLGWKMINTLCGVVNNKSQPAVWASMHAASNAQKYLFMFSHQQSIRLGMCHDVVAWKRSSRYLRLTTLQAMLINSQEFASTVKQIALENYENGAGALIFMTHI